MNSRQTRRGSAGSETDSVSDRLLDVGEASRLLSLKPSTLYQWAHERRIPVVKLYGRALRFRLSTIEKLITDSERPALRALRQAGGNSLER
jgi:excisionase family DNA binding protein